MSEDRNPAEPPLPPRRRITDAEARRMLSFCLSREHQVEIEQSEDRCVLAIVPPHEPDHKAQRFEGARLEDCLRAAARAGAVRADCLDRQMRFLASFKSRPTDVASGSWTDPTTPTTPELESSWPDHARKLDIGHFRALAEFRYQIRRFLAFSERAAHGAGLEVPQHQTLLAIKGLPGTKRATLSVVAERMCMEIPAFELVLSTLFEKGLVVWGYDRREKVIELTTAGQTVLSKLTLMHRNQILSVGPIFIQALGAAMSGFEAMSGDDPG